MDHIDKRKLFRSRGAYWLDNDFIHDWPEEAKAIQNEVTILHAEHDFMTDRIKFIGVSWHFEEISEGVQIPEYTPERDGTEIRFIKKQ